MSTVKILSILEAASIEVELREKETDLSKTLMTKEDGAKLSANHRIELATHKKEVIKWISPFWIGQMAATAAIVKLLQ